MKISRKITTSIALLLFFVLIFAVAASASDAQRQESKSEGILVSSNDFENKELGTAENGGGLVIYDPTNSGPRMGEYKICSSDDGNKYLTQKYGAEKYDTYPPYIEVAYGNAASVKSSGGSYYLAPANYPFSKIKYYALDLDIMMPTGEITSGIDICPVFISYTVDKDNNKLKTHYSSSPSSAMINFSNGEDGSFVITAKKSGTSASFTAKVGEWKHVTYLIEMDLSDNRDANDTVTSYNFSRSKIHIYVDGDKLLTIDNPFESVAGVDLTSTYHEGCADYASIREFRINFPKTLRTEVNENQICAFDNVNLTLYKDDYTGSYTDVINNHYNADYKKPDITSVASVDGVRYTTFEEAFENIKEGSALVLRKDYTGTYTPTVAHTVTVGEYSFNYEAGSYYIDELDEDGNINFRNPTADELVTVTWYGLDGEIIRIDENFVKGKTVTPPKAPSIRDNGWYDADYAWGYDDFSYAESFVITADTDFYPVLTEIRPNISAAMYTVRVLGSIEVLLYLEADTNRPDGISSVTLSHGSNALVPFEEVVELEYLGDYLVYDLGLFALGSLCTDTKTITVKFDATLPMGQTRKLEAALDINVLDYIETVMSSPEYNAAHSTVAALINYIAAATEFTNGELDDRVTYLVKTFGFVGTLQTGTSIGSTSSNYTAIKEYLSSISFAPDAQKPGYRLIFKDDTRVKNISYSVSGNYDAYSDFYKNGASNYSISESSVTFFSGSEFIKEAIISNIPLYNATVLINITLTLGDGTTVSGSYDLAKFYQSVKKGALKPDGVNIYTAEEAAAYKNFTEKLLAFSAVAEKYAFQNSSDTVKDSVKHIMIKYSDYGAVGDGVTDDFAAIKKAHAEANALAANGYINVTVAAEEGAVYYIGAGNLTKESEAIIIKTSTDWSGAFFIIDDTALVSGSIERELHIFNIAADTAYVTYNSSANNSAGAALSAINANGGIIAENTNEFNLGLLYPATVTVRGLYGTDVTIDTVSIDSKGNLTSPFTKDFTSITAVTVYRSDDRKITVTGGEFITLLGEEKGSANAYKRGILISRSGTALVDLTHCIFGDTKKSAEYSSFVEIANASGVTVSSLALSLDPIYLSVAENECEILVNGAVNVKILNITKSTLPEEEIED